MVIPMRRSISFAFTPPRNMPGAKGPAELKVLVADFSSWDYPDQVRMEMAVTELVDALGFRIVEKIGQWTWVLEPDDGAL